MSKRYSVSIEVCHILTREKADAYRDFTAEHWPQLATAVKELRAENERLKSQSRLKIWVDSV